ncbi:hypothetical protein [Kouleothrix sp.]|jgi:hypothetical protein|uniref:hypothetical protein n=1 Tax=Kouleothrix sp. TaxID=2779161 RepID=UPI00391C8598
MSDWTKQAEEVMKTWTKAQQDLWDTWRRSMPIAGASQAEEGWNKAVGFWKEAVDRSLSAQMEWAKLWADSIKAQKSMPKEMSAWTDQLLATMQTWNESQAKFWEGVLSSMQHMTPDALRQRLDEGAQAAFTNWQDAVQKAMQAQQDLSSFWTKGGKKG